MAFNKQKTAIAAGIIAAVLAAGGGGYYVLTSGKQDGIAIMAADITEVASDDITNSIPASGTISPVREVSLSTTLTGPVASLKPKVGDRVQARQLVATIDVSEQERELANQRATASIDKSAGLRQAEAAQLQLNQLQESIDKGLHPELNSAQSAVRSAQSAYDDAQRKVDEQLADAAEDPAVRESALTVGRARESLRSAQTNSLQAALGSMGQTTEGEVNGISMASQLLTWAEADSGVEDAAKRLREAEEEHALTIERTAKTNRKETAELQRAASAAYAELANAQLSGQAAELSVQQQIASQSQALDHALQSAAGAEVASEQATAKLELEIQSADVHSPIAGLITAVHASEGKPAEGALITVADDSTLLIKTNIKEADLARVKIGNKATFTSPSSPGKSYEGEVTFISPVAAGAAPTNSGDKAPSSSSGSGSGTGSTKAEFPIEIAVHGDREGLRLGSSAKLKIVTSSARNALTVPLSAVFEKDGKDHVLVLHDGAIEARPVTVGLTSDFDAAITSGLKAGDQVISKADEHKDQEGQAAFVVEGGGEGSKK